LLIKNHGVKEVRRIQTEEMKGFVYSDFVESWLGTSWKGWNCMFFFPLGRVTFSVRKPKGRRITKARNETNRNLFYAPCFFFILWIIMS